MKKKVVSAVISAVMASALVAGCGSSSSSSSSSAASTGAASTEAASTEAASTEAASTEASSEASTEASGDYTVNEAAAADPAVTLTMAEVNPLDGTICGAMDTKFKEAVEAMSGGSITIDLQGSGVLGVEADILDGMIGGTGSVDICRISAFALNSYGAEKSTLLSLPYTFKDKDHFWAFANSDLADQFLNESEEKGLGVRGLYFGEEGFRDFFTVKGLEVHTPDDMKGKKIRVSNDPIMTAMVQDLGATPSPVSMSEIYSSMQNGTIDGAEQPVANYLSNSFQEVGPNLTLDEHTLGAMMTIITDDAFNNKLTENQQQVIEDAGKIASDYCHQVSDQKEQEALETLKSQGINVITVDDKTPWQKACQPIVDENVGDYADLYQQILDLAK